jgi:hypothetical protein
MDYLEKRLNADVMLIIYKKIHKMHFKDCLINFKYFLFNYKCLRCGYLGRVVSFYEDAYLCYACCGLNRSYVPLKDLNYRGFGAIKKIFFADGYIT